MIIKNKSWPSILRVQFSRSNFLKLEIFTLIVLVSQFFAIITVVLVVKLRTRVRKEREEIRNLAKSLANLRKVANIICIDRDATRSRIRNSSFSKYFEQVGQLSTSEKLSVYCQIRWNCVVGKYCSVLSAMIYRSSTSKMHLILKCDNSIFHPILSSYLL